MAENNNITLRAISEIILESILNIKSLNEHGPVKKKQIPRTFISGEL
jgi:hypothetical protein